MLKLFLIEAVPLDFLLALSSPLLKKVLGTNPRMKLKHTIRRREAFLKGWASRLSKMESKMHCFRPLWTTNEPECALCSLCVKWKALLTEVCKPMCEVVISGDLNKDILEAHIVNSNSQILSLGLLSERL